jgi:uncharacterized surface protein with fasciclin (FAS1) repeats
MKRNIKLLGVVIALGLVIAACSPAESADTTVPAAPSTTAEDMGATTVPAMGDSIADIAASNEDFSTLLAAVQAAGLTEALADPEATLTVFAPTNEAFEAALAALGITAEELLADTETLTSILTYHVLGEVVTSSDLAGAGMEEVPVTTLSGEELVVTVSDMGVGFADQTAMVATADVEASNGVIHVIDAVLLPPSLGA